jgi:hypothetical protein
MDSRPKARSRAGRPPAGLSADGVPEKTSGYPKLSIAMKPSTKAMLETLSAMSRMPAWRLVDRALWAYVEGMPPDDRKALQLIAERVHAAQGQG